MADRDPAHDEDHPKPGKSLRDRLWAREASQQFGRLRPSRSARSGLTRTQLVVLIAIPFVILAAWLEWVPGLRLVLLGSASLFFAASITLRGMALLTSDPDRPASRHASDARRPFISIIIAAYDEARILPDLLARLEKLQYPRDRVEFLLALEEGDRETISVARAYQGPLAAQVLTTPPGEPQTKPRALNYALRHARGDLVGVYDAEDRPDPLQLLAAADAFEAGGPDLACVQAPLNWYNRNQNWLTRQFALEYAAHFRVMLPLYVRLGWPLPLGGTSNFFRTDALRRVGAWDAHNVTEDADLGFRLHRAGYRCGLIPAITLEEAPFRLRPWFLQRTRWIKGYIQTFAVHSRHPDNTARKPHWMGLSLTLGTAIIAALLHLPFSLYSLWLAVVRTETLLALWPFYLFTLFGYAAAAATAWLGMRRMGWNARMTDLISMPLYWPLLTASALRALWQLAFNPYFWDKTEHGLVDED